VTETYQETGEKGTLPFHIGNAVICVYKIATGLKKEPTSILKKKTKA
jgi:hypothetical protein